ncbi:MAG: glycoside hydrolase family 97 N-terminal domain-containing protein [Phycisphaerae bacterium]
MPLVQTTAAWALMTCLAAATEPAMVRSPDGKVSFSLSTGPDGLAFTLMMDGQILLADSPLGLLPTGSDPLGPRLRVTNSVLTDIDQTWKPVCGTASQIRDRHRLLQADLAEPGTDGRTITLLVRAYDDGIAFRYRVPVEATEYKLDGQRCKEVPEQIRRLCGVVTSAETLDIAMASGGGCAIRFVSR